MSVPKYFEFMKPLLVTIQDGEDYKLQDLYADLASKFNLTEEDKSERIPSGKQPLYHNRIGWAKTYLKKAGLLESSHRGTVRITKQGKDVLLENPTQIDQSYLMKFPDFQSFSNSTTPPDANEKFDPQEAKSPQDLLGIAYQQITQSLQDDLLSEIKQSTPDFFEKLVVDLVIAMGYGGTAEDAAKVVGHTGDEGIDGIIKADRLGFDRIYIQAKKWDTTHSIGRPEIQRFIGALVGQGAVKGLFITTSSFTKDAYDFVQKSLNQRIVLVDGKLLTRLMIEHNLGVATQQVVEIKKIDMDYFDNGI